MNEPTVDLDKLLVPLVQGSTQRIDLSGSVTSGRLERTIEGASTITLTFRDPDRVITRSGLFLTYGEGEKAGKLVEKDIKLDGLPYRLVKVAKNGEEFETVWEDRAVALLRAANEPRRARRGPSTRAQFVQTLVESIRPKIPFFIPRAGTVQPLAPMSRQDVETQSASAKNPAFDRDARITVKHVRATGQQMRNLEIMLAVGQEMGCRQKVLVTAVMVVTQESSALTSATNGSHVGMFQQDPRYWPATRDPAIDSRAFFKAARAADRQNPNLTKAALAETVQRSGQGSLYAQWADEAAETVAAFGGGASASEQGGTVVFEKSYYFSVGRPQGPRKENYWDATGRMAEEVGHRRFVVGGEFWWTSEQDIFTLPAQATLSESTPGIESIDFDVDNGKRVDECVIQCRIDRWAGSPGGIVALKNMGAADGRWLISQIESDFFSTAATVTLKKPIKEKPEPRGELVTKAVAPTGGQGDFTGAEGTTREKIVQYAKNSLTSTSGFSRYSQAGALTTDPTPPSPARSDCSQWARAIYLKAGAPDPGTYTGQQVTRGHPVGTPQPGDLVFPGSNSHVEIFIGDGKTIGHGTAPIDYWSLDGMRSYFGSIHYRSYL